MSTISVDIDISTNAEKDMNVGGASVDTVVQPKSPAKPSTSLAVLIYAIFLIRFALVALRLHSLWPLLACIPLFVIIVTLVLGPSKTVRLFFGNRSYVPIDSPEFLQRIQDKYQPDISDLQTLGFAPLFAEGETFSVFRLLLGYPVVILLQMRSKREVISVAQGRVVIGFPIFASSDKTSYGHPSGLGIAFHTMFRDGTLLKSTNYGNDANSPTFVRRSSQGASISDTWSAHQSAIRSLQTDSNRVGTQFNFDAYIAIIRQEEV